MIRPSRRVVSFRSTTGMTRDLAPHLGAERHASDPVGDGEGVRRAPLLRPLGQPNLRSTLTLSKGRVQRQRSFSKYSQEDGGVKWSNFSKDAVLGKTLRPRQGAGTMGRATPSRFAAQSSRRSGLSVARH